MKKIISLLLIFVMLFGLCGCGPTEQEQGVIESLTHLLDAIKASEYDVVEKYSGSAKAGRDMFLVDTNDLNQFARLKVLKAVRDSMTYKIDKVEVAEDGTANINVTVMLLNASKPYRQKVSELSMSGERAIYEATYKALLELDDYKTYKYNCVATYNGKHWVIDYDFVDRVYNSFVPKVF